MLAPATGLAVQKSQANRNQAGRFVEPGGGLAVQKSQANRNNQKVLSYHLHKQLALD